MAAARLYVGSIAAPTGGLPGGGPGGTGGGAIFCVGEPNGGGPGGGGPGGGGGAKRSSYDPDCDVAEYPLEPPIFAVLWQRIAGVAAHDSAALLLPLLLTEPAC